MSRPFDHIAVGRRCWGYNNNHDGDEEPSTLSPLKNAEEALQRHLRKRRLVRSGQAVMLIGALVGVLHWLSHFGFFGPRPHFEMVVGYPAAGLIIIAGAILAGRK